MPVDLRLASTQPAVPGCSTRFIFQMHASSDHVSMCLPFLLFYYKLFRLRRVVSFTFASHSVL